MTQPVAPGARAACFEHSPDEPVACSPAAPTHPPPPSAPTIAQVPTGLRFCREASTVTEGYLCGELPVVTKACQKPSNRLDAYICDEPRMRALQKSVWQATLWVIKTIIASIAGRTPSR